MGCDFVIINSQLIANHNIRSEQISDLYLSILEMSKTRVYIVLSDLENKKCIV